MWMCNKSDVVLTSATPTAEVTLSLTGSTTCTGAREPSGPGLELMPDGCSGPKLGAQFAQLVKELRSEYAGAVTACAFRIASSVFGMPGRSILRALDAHGVSGTPAVMQQQVRPHSC
jgi:hypothetical protein